MMCLMYLPASAILTMAICVFVGIASLNEMFILGFNPFSSKVQTPFGPLMKSKGD